MAVSGESLILPSSTATALLAAFSSRSWIDLHTEARIAPINEFSAEHSCNGKKSHAGVPLWAWAFPLIRSGPGLGGPNQNFGRLPGGYQTRTGVWYPPGRRPKFWLGPPRPGPLRIRGKAQAHNGTPAWLFFPLQECSAENSLIGAILASVCKSIQEREEKAANKAVAVE